MEWDWIFYDEGEGGGSAEVAIAAGAAQATAEAAAAAADEVAEEVDELEEVLTQVRMDLEQFKADTMNEVQRLWSETWQGVSYNGCQSMIAEAIAPLMEKLDACMARMDECERRVAECQSHPAASSPSQQAGIQVEPPQLPEKKKGLLAEIFLTPR